MASLERRLEVLEQRNGPPPAEKIFIVVSFVDPREPAGRLVGYRWRGKLIRRERSESEADVFERVRGLVQNDVASPIGGYVLEERDAT